MRRVTRRATARRAGSGTTQRNNGMLGNVLAGTSNYFASAASQGIRGSASGFYVASLMMINTGQANNYCTHCTGGTDGWNLYMPSSTTLVFTVASSLPALINSPAYTVTPTVGKIISVVGVYDFGALTIRLYVNGAEIGAGTAIVGYTAAAGATLHKIGNSAGSPDLVTFGVLGGNGVPSAANIAAWSAACKATRSLATMPGAAPQHRWVPSNPVANMPDTVGSDTMTKNGTPPARSTNAWGY